jgi:arylsulfatase A-like enzyme
MNRREFSRLATAGAAALAFPSPQLLAQPGDQPNVLLFLLDDLNDWPTCLGGHPLAITPNIDALAASGVLFTDCHANSTACIPSRTSILNGSRPSSTGVYNNFQDWTSYIPNPFTIPHNFQANGYQITRSGKIFHPSITSELWDDFTGWPTLSRPSNYPVSGLPEITDYSKYFDWGVVDVPLKANRTHQWANTTIQMLQSGVVAPFFHAVGFAEMHDPWYVPREFIEPFPLDAIELPDVPPNELNDLPQYVLDHVADQRWHDAVTGQKQWRKAIQSYLGSLLLLDYEIGRVMDALEASPYANDTIVVFTSDHGLHLGEKFQWRKFTLWKEATRVPLIFRIPGVTQAGSTFSHASELLDIYPTLIDYCGLSPAPLVEGQTLRPQLEDPSIPTNRPAIITSEYLENCVKTDDWRYMRYPDDSEELYDLNADPLEHTNLAEDPAYDSIKADLALWLPAVNVQP